MADISDYQEAMHEYEELLRQAIGILTEVRADGIMEEWGDDLPKRIDALLERANQVL